MKFLVVLVIAFLNIKESFALAPFYKEKARGWYFFEERKLLKNQEKQQTEVIQRSVKDMSDDEVIALMKASEKQIDAARARMVMEPNLENTKNFMLTNKKVIDGSLLVGSLWKTNLLLHPELSTQEISEQKRYIEATIEQAKKIEKIRVFAKKFKLIYFFKESCGYCREFTPILRNLASKYNFTIHAISLDGGKLGDFETSIDNELAEKLEVDSTPTVMGYNQYHDTYIPVSRGLTSLSELEQNIIHVHDYFNRFMQSKNEGKNAIH